MAKPVTAYEPIVSESVRHRMGGSRTRRRLLAAGIVVAVLGSGLTVFVMVLTRQSRPPPLSSYALATVRAGTLEETVTLAGAVHLAGSKAIASPQAGVVEEVCVREGETVGPGDLIARISSESLDLAIRETDYSLQRKRREHEELLAEGALSAPMLARSLARCERMAEQAARTAEDRRELVAIGAVSPASVRSAEAEAASASAELAGRRDSIALEEMRQRNQAADLQAEIRMLEEKLARYEGDLERCTVRSPTEGRIQKVGASKGAYINRYETVAIIADSSTPLVLARLPDRYLESVSAGFQASVLVAGNQVPALVVAVGTEVHAEASGYGSVLDIQISLTEPPERLVEGMPAGVTLVIRRHENALLVRRGPFFGTNQERFAFRVQGARAVRTEVRFGLATETEIEVLEGLQAGDCIITSAYTEFVNQEEVTLSLKEGGSE